MSESRGSEKLMTAWEARTLTEQSVSEIRKALDESPATVRSVEFHGGAQATGMSLSLSYTDDDVPMCGNDIFFWLNWYRRFGGVIKEPHIVINGTPWPEEILIDLTFGHSPGVGHVGGAGEQASF